MPVAVSRCRPPAPANVRSTLGRATLSVLFFLGLMTPALSQGAPVAAQASTVSFRTAEAAPADAFFYAVATLDDRSEQVQLANELLHRTGIGEALDTEVAKALSDESGEALPLDVFLGGEVGVVVTATAIQSAFDESMGTADFDAMMEAMLTGTPVAEIAAPDEQGFAFVLDTRAPDTAWAAIRGSIQEEANEESTYEGTTILYGPPASADDQGTAAARAGDLILVATTPADLEPLIDTAGGSTPNITTLPEFTTARDALPAEFLAFGFMNSLASTGVDLGPLQASAQQLGGDSITAFAVSAAEAGFRKEVVTFPATGATATPGAANFNSELVALAPADTVVFASAADLGASGVLDAIGAGIISFALGMMGSFGMDESGATPTAPLSPKEEIASQYETAAAMIGVNLQTDLFQQLTGEYGFWLTANMEKENLSGLFASGTENPATVANTLMQLSFLLQGAAGAETPLTTRDVDGDQVYVFEMGDEAGSTIEFGVIGDRLVIGKGDAVERLAGGGGESLADNAQFQAVMDTLPAEHNGLFYVDMTRAIPILELAAQEPPDFNLGGGTEFPDASESCASYATQEEAQAAYDAAETGTFDLDQDFDGEVCEDYFAPSQEAAATPEQNAEVVAMATAIDYSAIKAYASVSYDDENGFHRSSSILYITE